MIFNKRFGRYTLVKKLAMGGMAEVFLALKRGPDRFERLVVLKRLHEHLSDDRAVVDMFYSEARLGGLFNHENLISIFDADVIDGHHTMVMEFVPGQTVDEFAARMAARATPVPIGLALSIVAEAADGLHSAHVVRDLDGTAMRIVHRDVSPHNIMIGFDGDVRVFDFGVAIAATSGGGGQLAGKTAYMSPEQCKGKDVDARSDVFALGIVLHELLTGKPLFKRDNHIKSLRAITEDVIPPPSSIRPDLTPGVDAIVMKALERDAAKRYESAHALQLALADHLAATNDLVVAHDALESLVNELFQAEKNETRAVIEKILLAPETSEATIDLSTFDLKAEGAGDDGIHIDAAGASPLAPALTLETGPIDAIGPVGGPASIAMAGQLKRARRMNAIMAFVALLALAGAAAAWVLSPGAPAATTPEPGTEAIEIVQVTIESDPPGAQISIDGAERAETTPAEIPLAEGIEAAVTLSLDGHITHETTIVPSATSPSAQRVSAVLEVDQDSENAPIGELRVVFNPADADVFLNGQPAGSGSPVVLTGLALNQEHQLRLSREGFETLHFPVSLDSADPLEVQLDLSEALELGVLTVTSRPSGASIRINDEELGETPLEGLELPANQTYTIEVRRSGYQRWRRAILLRPGATEEFVAELTSESRREERAEEPSAAADPPDEPSNEGQGGDEPAAEPEPEPEEEPYQLLLE